MRHLQVKAKIIEVASFIRQIPLSSVLCTTSAQGCGPFFSSFHLMDVQKNVVSPPTHHPPTPTHMYTTHAHALTHTQCTHTVYTHIEIFTHSEEGGRSTLFLLFCFSNLGKFCCCFLSICVFKGFFPTVIFCWKMTGIVPPPPTEGFQFEKSRDHHQ